MIRKIDNVKPLPYFAIFLSDLEAESEERLLHGEVIVEYSSVPAIFEVGGEGTLFCVHVRLYTDIGLCESFLATNTPFFVRACM